MTYGFLGNNSCLNGCEGLLYADNHSQLCVAVCNHLTQEFADPETHTCV